MATEVTVVDEAALTQTIDEVRSDSGDTNWCLVNHADGNPAVIQVCGSGNGGVEEMASNLADDQPMYALVRVTEIIDMSQTTKFVYVIWLGKDISFVKRGKFGVVSGSVERFFQPYQISVTFDGDSKEEVTQDHLMSKLQETSGTKSKVLEATEAKTRPERGFTSFVTKTYDPNATTNKPSGMSKVGKQGSQYGGLATKSKSASQFNYEQDVVDALIAIRSDQDDKIWMKAVFANKVKDLQLSGQGDDITELLPNGFAADEVAIAFMRLTDVVDDIPTVKFVYILWCGEGVRPLTRGKLTTAKGDIEELLTPYHLHIEASTPADIKLNIIQDKVGLASGSKSNVK